MADITLDLHEPGAAELMFGLPVAPDTLQPIGFRPGWLRDITVVDLVAAQASRRPDAPAVSDAHGALTYGELMAAASTVAADLAAAGVRREEVVGVVAARGRAWVAAILGIWMSGAVYLPIEPSAPAARAGSILARSGTRRLLVDPDSAPAVRAAIAELDIEVIPLAPEGRAAAPAPALPPRPGADTLAYVIFTSGSTGQAKGAMVEHRGLLNHLLAKIEDLGITSRDKIAELAPAAFDISIWQVFAALVAGGQCHVASEDEVHDPDLLASFLRTRGITVAQVVPSLLRGAFAAGSGFRGRGQDPFDLRILSLTGEAAPVQLCREWLMRYPGVTLLNAYGPTECSDDVTHFLCSRLDALERPSTPIGVAVRNTYLYVLSEGSGGWRATPPGEPGELFVAGPCVGRGYLGDPERTAAAFATVTTAGGPMRCYRTGDIVRLLADGVLEFLGRADRQVKIRGHRVELGEIEAALEASGMVRQAVLDYAAGPGAPRPTLCAYVLSNGNGLDVSALRDVVSKALPAFMHPDRYIPVPAIPLTANGKIDLNALRATAA